MEGTSEDPLVKDPALQDAEVAVKDKVIPNGVNGSLEDHAEELGDSSGGSNRDEAEERVDEEDNNTDNATECEKEDEEDEEDEDDEDRDEAAQGRVAASEKDVVAVESEPGNAAQCASEGNNVCAVSSGMREAECCDEEYASASAMEVDDDEDEHTDNSDVECLDAVENSAKNAAATIERMDTSDVVVESKSASSAEVEKLNDSVEVVEDVGNGSGSGSAADTSDVKICEENGSCGSPDIEEITDGARSNGHNNSSQQEQPGSSASSATSTPAASKDSPKKKPRKQIDLSNITPRRSSRNIKRTSYIEKELEEEPEDDGGGGSSDIEEIKPEDPLACIVDATKDKENSKIKSSPIKSSKTTIVVSDTKRLVEIAAGSKSSKGGKKEPTLVIIDTNSILSGRGGIPVGGGGGIYGSKTSTSSSSSSSTSSQSHHHQHHHHHHSVSAASSFSVLPMGHTQTMYPNMRTTITPVPMSRASQVAPKSMSVAQPLQQQTQQQQQPVVQPQILPTLTDDMFVVEAPSFIVPYVYEKPPLKPLKDFVTKLEKSIAECEKEEEEKRKAAAAQLLEDGKKVEEAAAAEIIAEATSSTATTSGKMDDKSEGDESEGETAERGGKKMDTSEGDKDSSVSTVDLTEKGDEKTPPEEKNKTPTYFDLPLGKFFMQIGVNLVQEFVQTDLLRTQKRKQGKHGSASAETQLAINSLIKNLEFSKENNEPFHLEMKKCEFCSFKTESALVMQHHLETPHMRNYAYKCNFCPLEVRSPHDILFHMEAEHNTRGRLERGPAFHQCPNCPFEDNQKGKLTRHILACAKKFRPERNLEPATDWEPPAKIPRLNRPRQVGPVNANALAMAMGAKGTQQPLLPKLLPAPVTGRGRGRPPMQPRYSDLKSLRPGSGTTIRQDNVASMMYRPTSSGLLVPTSYQFGSNQIFQVVGGSGTVTSAVTGVSSGSCGSSGRPTPIALVSNIIDSQSRLSSSSTQNTSTGAKSPAAKLLSQPSISITPLPRTTSQTPLTGSGSSSKPGGKNTFVICEICDGYIKDLEQLRNHMQWIHKVKIHPKMIYNRPPLNCQKCQFRFFTDQGLERHLLGSHGLVTSSMQEAANKGKDAGRCPACGRVYQWKLLNHVARDHGMTLKPAHLSYKCTVCTATFGMYKQFENHVYSAHSVVAKKVMDKKNAPSSPSSRSNDSLLKPLKINDEITIIPQPAKPTTRGSQGRGK